MNAKRNRGTTRKTYGKELKAQAVNMVRSGIKIREVESQLRISPGTLSHWLADKRDASKPKRSRRVYGEDVKQAAVNSVLVDGVSIPDAAKTLGVLRGTLVAWVHAAKKKSSSTGQTKEMATEFDCPSCWRLQSDLSEALRVCHSLLKMLTNRYKVAS